MGVHLFDYLPGNAFLAELPGSFSPEGLKKYAASGVYPVPGQVKIAREIQQDPEAYSRGDDKLIAVSFFGTMTRADVVKELIQAGARVVPTRIQPEHAVFINAGGTVLRKIAAFPFVSYLGVQGIKAYPLNYNNRASHGADALGASMGRNLQGRGVTVGMGDNSDPYTHVDFTGRLLDRFAAPVSTHGTHTSGTAAGGGIINPMYKGMAPQATLISQYFNDILVNAPTYVADNHMVLTNNSYTQYDNGCLWEGEYDVYANFLDALMLAYPSLLNIFAAGNDGALSCAPYSAPFGTIKSGFQCAKNVLTVGSLNNLNPGNTIFAPNSSCGPVNDGRIKPEITAGGTFIISTTPNNTYGTSSGTSMATPTVTGSVALLYERYRQLHSGADPSAALIKALVCNSATDLGKPGPDFIFGFGMLNVLATAEAMEGNHYFTGEVTNNGNASFTLPGVPAGTQQVKILLYWPDAPAAPFAASTLVNNLDLTVSSPDGVLHHPMILNTDLAHLNDAATEGVDNLNNIEQVVIDNPPAGSFSISIKGTVIPAGPQPFVVAYQVIQPSVVLEYPAGNETWVPGQPETIRWTAYGGDTNPFSIEYSADNGSSWSIVSNAVPATNRSYTWTTPSTAASQALIRVTRNGTGYSATSNYSFTVLGQPGITVTNPCQGYAQISWAAVTSAASYDIMRLKGDTMQTIANTTATSYLLGGLSKDSSYWLAVRAVNNTIPGRRSIAANILPSGGVCALPALDNDLAADIMTSPVTGRMYTTSQLSSSSPVRIGIRNLGTIPTSGSYSLSYRINGGSIVTESTSAVIAPNTEYYYQFTNGCDLSAAGAYSIQAWVSYPGDPSSANDTFSRVIRQLQNDPIALSPAYTEGFESATVQTHGSAVVGLDGVDRSDFSTSNSNGRIRTFVNSGFARTGSRSAILDETNYSASSSADSLILTFNLSGYSAGDDLWLDFFYRNQGIDFNLPGNKVWIRGNDGSAWIPVHTLSTDASMIGIYQPAPHINIGDVLAGAIPAQAVSSSFQVKFGEEGFTSANSVIPDGDLDDGYSFDDITITRAVNDISVPALVPPNLTGVCTLSGAETIRLKVRNYSPVAAVNVPVSYSVNGLTVTESIPVINGLDSITYTFSHKADLSAPRHYTLRGWAKYPGDNYAGNDTASDIGFQTTPVISSFPYLEGFEDSDGSWYTGGINSSWEWGTPAKIVINKAANGSKCWVTSLTSIYNNNELSYLYSPCFDLSGLTSPVLSFSHIFQTEGTCDCDYHWAEYSTDGVTWTKLGRVAEDSGTNWYDNSGRQAWQLSDTIWHVSSYDIPSNGHVVRFRIVMSSDPGTTLEGVGIDDVHIFDKAPVYSGPDISSGLVQPVSGNGWIHFDQGGGRILSINPNGQDLGATRAEVHFYPGPVRNDGGQYYLNRNIVIRSANPPMGEVSVRYYFLASEADSLIHASGCSGCPNPGDAYQAGVMQYSSPVAAEEDSVLRNDSSGTFRFFSPHKDLSIIPYDKGYYAEYFVSGFSEFWINNGNPGVGRPYPLALLSFTAAKTNSGALLQWGTKEEKATSRFIIQKSGDGANFYAIDSVKATGDSGMIHHYQYTDYHLINGINFYRLKMVGLDGSFKYSPVRSVSDTINNLIVSCYPNPVRTGILYISTSVNCESVRLSDISGRILQTVSTHGFLNVLRPGNIARGVYFVRVIMEGGEKTVKILVN